MSEIPAGGRALSFGGVADEYDRYRPGPPPAAVDWVLPAGAREVLELAAGTGGLTRRLVERHAGQVVATEPDARMRAVLARRSSGALVVGSFAEALPLAGARFDAVVVSSAWHWMDPERTVAEVVRVLRPGGRLGVLGNRPDRSAPWVAELLGRRRRPPDGGSGGGRGGDPAGWRGGDPAGGRSSELSGGQEPGWRRRRGRHPSVPDLPAGGPFSAPETAVFEWAQPMTRSEVVGLAGTYSGLINRSPGERAQILDWLGTVAGAHPAFAGREQVEVPMVCHAWRATLA